MEKETTESGKERNMNKWKQRRLHRRSSVSLSDLNTSVTVIRSFTQSIPKQTNPKKEKDKERIKEKKKKNKEGTIRGPRTQVADINIGQRCSTVTDALLFIQ